MKTEILWYICTSMYVSINVSVSVCVKFQGRGKKCIDRRARRDRWIQ